VIFDAAWQSNYQRRHFRGAGHAASHARKFAAFVQATLRASAPANRPMCAFSSTEKIEPVPMDHDEKWSSSTRTARISFSPPGKLRERSRSSAELIGDDKNYL